jgi:hypothetical protein
MEKLLHSMYNDDEFALVVDHVVEYVTISGTFINYEFYYRTLDNKLYKVPKNLYYLIKPLAKHLYELSYFMTNDDDIRFKLGINLLKNFIKNDKTNLQNTKTL